MPLIVRSRVPASLESVTTVRPGAEVPPREVGCDASAVEAIWRNVETLYRSGIHPAVQLCVRRRGAVLIDRAIGYAKGNGPDDAPETPKVLATPDTPFNLFSASKAVTAMVIHLLDQRRLIHINDPVCEYIREFGVKKKQWITIHDVLGHRAGIPNLPPQVMTLEQLEDQEGIIRLLCEAEPAWRPGKQLAYHAVTGGFILAEVVRRVTGRDIRTFLHREILAPLGFRWMSYGVRRRDVGRVALNYFTGPPPVPPLSTLLRRALGVPFRDIPALSNDRRYLTSIVPSGNVIATANEASRFYRLLLDGGELDGVRLFEPRTLRRATSEQSYLEFDLTLGLPLRYGLGFMLGGKWVSLYGPDTQYAFGHIGFTNVVTWADPERQVAAALMTSGKPLLYPELYQLYNVIRQIGTACPKETRRKPGGPRRGAATERHAKRA